MARIALATCGTRGIGRAIAIALKEDGCEVAAVYRGNDEAAKQLQTDQGIRCRSHGSLPRQRRGRVYHGGDVFGQWRPVPQLIHDSPCAANRGRYLAAHHWIMHRAYDDRRSLTHRR